MNGFRDSYREIKNSQEIKKQVKPTPKVEEPAEEEEERPVKKGDGLLKLLQLQLTVCMIFFLLVMGAKAINTSFYTSVRAGTFEKNYRLTNLFDINTKLDAISEKSPLIGFVLGRSNTPPSKQSSKDKADSATSSDLSSNVGGGDSSIAGIQENTSSDTSFASTTSTDVLSAFAAARKIPTIDESTVANDSQADSSEEETADKSTDTGNTSSQTVATVKIPDCDSALHDWGGTFFEPVKSYVTSKFGIRTDPIAKKQSFHTGVDVGVKTGTQVLCPAKGKVTKTGKSSVWGNYIYVTHDNGFETFYAHLSKIKVKKGTEVAAKTVLALSGNTGRSTGPHLHFEVHFGGKYQDPQLYFDFK